MPGIKGVWKMPGGGTRFINVIAIEQQHAGHAKMAGLVAAGCGSAAYLGRIIIIVDDDIDITNPAEVMWAVAHALGPEDRDRHHRRDAGPAISTRCCCRNGAKAAT